VSSSPSQRSRTALGIGIVVVLAAVVVGSFIVFGGGGDDGDALPASAPPIVDPNAPPELRNTGEDWDQIVRSIVEYREWLFNHPDPALLDRIQVPSYEFFAEGQLGLTNLATKGWRYDPPLEPLTVELVRLQERIDNVVILFIRFGPTPPIRVVDPNGAVVQDSPGVPPNAILWTLVREPADNEHWRLSKVTPFPDQTGTS
jgi:hypothetical protein